MVFGECVSTDVALSRADDVLLADLFAVAYVLRSDRTTHLTVL